MGFICRLFAFGQVVELMGLIELEGLTMNLEPEVRRGYSISAEMKGVWKVQMDLLKKLLDVCETYGLRIWAEGGTLLGAVREHGYIPWDDDIDMAMFRDDYDKLVAVAPKEFNHPYFFQCAYTEKIYPRGHAQLRMDGTTAILPYPEFVNTHQGIFIDIFPYDGVPDDSFSQDELIAKRNKMMAALRASASSLSLLHPGRSFRPLRDRLRFKTLFRRFEDLMRENKVKENRIVSCLSFIVDPDHFFRDKQWYDGTILMPFEDILIPVPSGYHQILLRQYGDYMIPRQAPTYHGGFWKLDTNTPYQVYIPELKRFLRCKNN